MTIKRTTILSFALSVFCTVSFAQVTIGSSEPPVAGSLLDLKDGTIGPDPLINAKGGLLLPRVEIKAKNALTMGDNEIKNDDNAWTDHVGLIVYNIKPLTEGTICPIVVLGEGLHVWDGTEWQGLVALPTGVDETNWVGNLTTGVGFLTDYEGNTYPTKRFNMNGTDAGIWTTVNSYSTRDRNGKPLDGGARLNPGYKDNNSGAITICTIADLADDLSKVGYGEATTSSPPVTWVTRKNFVKIFGLSYLWNQAMNICPTGWHLPTFSEWQKLSLAHGQGTTVDNSGAAMRKNRDYYSPRTGGVGNRWGADTETAAFSGFDAVPSGLVRADGLALNFSSYIYLWCSTSENRDVFINSTQPVLGFTTSSSDIYESVRCVKD